MRQHRQGRCLSGRSASVAGFRPRSAIALASAIVLVAATIAPVGAQQGQPDPAYEPKLVQFPAEGIDIVEAVRLTLANQPSIMLQDAQVDFQAGVAQEQTGAFDLALNATISYEYRIQELRDSVKERERMERDDLADLLAENEGERDMAQAQLTALQQIQAGTADVSDFVDDPDDGMPPVIDQEIVAGLLVTDALLENATPGSDAEADLLATRQALLNDAISSTSEGLQEAIEGFNRAQSMLVNLGDVPDDEEFVTSQFSLSAPKLYRTGVTLTPFADGNFNSTNFVGKRRPDGFGGKGIEDTYTFRFGVAVNVPLMRGRGKDATGAREKAAQIQQRAEEQLLEFQAQAATLSTVLAYWDLRAAQGQVAVAENSVRLQNQLVELTQQLIDDGDKAEVEIERVRASQANSQARLEDSLRQLHIARVNLAATMGLVVDAGDGSLPLPRTEFPAVDYTPLSEAELSALLRGGTSSRRDLMAARTIEESGRVLFRQAETDLRPILDINAQFFSTAVGEAEISEAVDRWVGPSASFGLEFDKPLANNIFKGRVKQTRADLRQRQISANDLQRTIQLNIVQNARALARAAQRVRQAEASVRAYQTTIQAEYDKYRDGDATLIDAILTEDQQTGARGQLVAAQQTYARTLAQLRFEAGQLIGEGNSVSSSSLMATPRGARR